MLCPSCSRLASLSVGRKSSRRRLAALSTARSLAAAESTTMSPGDWPRSTASVPSDTCPGVVTSRCIRPSSASIAPNGSCRHPPKQRGDAGTIEAGKADDDEATGALFAVPPRTVEIVLKPRADALDHQPGVPAGNRRHPLDAEHAIERQRLARARRKLRRVAGRGD